MKDVKVVEKKTKTKNNKTKQNKKTTKNKKEEHAARLRIHHLSFKSTKKKSKGCLITGMVHGQGFIYFSI